MSTQRRFLVLALLADGASGQTAGDVLCTTKITTGVGGLDAPFSYYAEFGAGMASPGDLDGDGISELAVGAPDEDLGSQSGGAVWILFLDADGTVQSWQTIGDATGGFGAALPPSSHFGMGVGMLGDLDGDGIGELSVNPGVWVLFLNPDGTVRHEQQLAPGIGGVPPEFTFLANGAGIGDLDGDGVADAAYTYGTLHVVFFHADGTAKHVTEVDPELDLGLTVSFAWGASVAGLGDANGDGTLDVAVGDPADTDGGISKGAVWILSLEDDGTVVGAQKISSLAGGFTGSLVGAFGSDVTSLGDLDGDGVTDLAVGEEEASAAWILFLKPDLTVRAAIPLGPAPGAGFPALDASDHFGASLTALDDVDGDGARDLAVSASWDSEGVLAGGAAYVFRLQPGPAFTPHGCGANPPGSLVPLGALPVVGEPLLLGLDNPLSTQAPGALPFVALSGQPSPGHPCGFLIPGLGMSGPGAPGELLIGIGAGNPFAIHSGTPWPGPGQHAQVPILVPGIAALVGQTLHAQGLLFDLLAGAGVQLALTNGLVLHIGS